MKTIKYVVNTSLKIDLLKSNWSLVMGNQIIIVFIETNLNELKNCCCVKKFYDWRFIIWRKLASIYLMYNDNICTFLFFLFFPSLSVISFYLNENFVTIHSLKFFVLFVYILSNLLSWIWLKSYHANSRYLNSELWWWKHFLM